MNKNYECKICIEEAKEPIVTQCGYLFCWPCILQWQETKNTEIIPCPLCHSELDLKKVIPLYTSKEEHQKRTENIPQRPRPNTNTYQDPEGDNFKMHFNSFGF